MRYIDGAHATDIASVLAPERAQALGPRLRPFAGPAHITSSLNRRRYSLRTHRLGAVEGAGRGGPCPAQGIAAGARHPLTAIPH